MGLRNQAQKIKSCLLAVFCLSTLSACQTARTYEGEQSSPLTDGERDRASALARYGQGMLREMNEDSGAALTNFLAAARLDPDNEELHFRAAMGLLRDRRFAEASDLMMSLCARKPKSVKAWLWLALTYRAADDTDKALETYQRASKIDPSSPVPYLEMANIFIKEKREAEAVDVLARGVKKVSQPVDLLKYLSDILIRRTVTGQATPAELRKLGEVTRAMEKEIARNPKDSTLMHRMGDLYIAQHEEEKAVACFEKIEEMNPGDLRTKQKLALRFLALGDKSKATEALETLAGRQPDNARIQYYLGELYEQTGEKDKAIQHYEKAAAGRTPEPAAYLKLAILRVDDDPGAAIEALNEARQKMPKDARLVEMLAYVYLGQKDYANALENFNRAQHMMDENKSEPMTPNYNLHFAIATQMAGQIDDAASILFKAMGTDPAYLDAYVQFMFREQESSNLVQGVNVLAQVAHRTPDNPQLFVYIGLLNNYAKRYSDAAAAFEKTVQLAENAPNQDDLLTPVFYFWFGSAYERDGQIDKAEQMFRTCLSLDPEHAEAYNYVAYMWAEKGLKLDEALKFSKKSLELEPESAAFMDTLGWVYFMQGEYKKAQKEIQRAANLMPEDPTIVEHMGDLMEKLGKQDKAVKFWKRSFVLDPENEKLAAKLAGRSIDLAPLKKESDRRDKEKKSPKIKRAVDDAASPVDEEFVPSEDPALLLSP